MEDEETTTCVIEQKTLLQTIVGGTSFSSSFKRRFSSLRLVIKMREEKNKTATNSYMK